MLKLPNEAITPIYARSSGDTLTFTSYLSRVSSTWRSRVGSGSVVGFPVGLAAVGDQGITSELGTTARGADLGRWVGYAIGPGQRFGPSLDFAALPANVLRASQAAVARLSKSG